MALSRCWMAFLFGGSGCESSWIGVDHGPWKEESERECHRKVAFWLVVETKRREIWIRLLLVLNPGC